MFAIILCHKYQLCKVFLEHKGWAKIIVRYMRCPRNMFEMVLEFIEKGFPRGSRATDYL